MEQWAQRTVHWCHRVCHTRFKLGRMLTPSRLARCSRSARSQLTSITVVCYKPADPLDDEDDGSRSTGGGAHVAQMLVAAVKTTIISHNLRDGNSRATKRQKSEYGVHFQAESFSLPL